ncbi:NYN domain-containing protein [Lentibacillus sp. JNUCC-1]|uniref:NYN domain-containing protein n=1 Tax=Lentibacillus sp. JNUCC-1 TaxID=2654513 RepID=UPI0012E819AD|nr:NYN domain-containing protein [Lentibacillus sp. JNUCC-1]
MIILVVDGYNIIGDWEELKALKDKDIDQARNRLVEMMAEYQAYTGHRVIVVFDAYEAPGRGSKLNPFGVEVIYTKENETADERIERYVKDLKNVQTKVYVATSDYTEQRTIFAQGALRKSARELYIELEGINNGIAKDIERYRNVQPHSKIPLNDEMLALFERWRRGH